MSWIPGTFDEEEAPEAGEALHYGIKPRPVYYVCLRCGRRILVEEFRKYTTLLCPHCGYRVFIKERAPPEALGRPRRVYAV